MANQETTINFEGVVEPLVAMELSSIPLEALTLRQKFLGTQGGKILVSAACALGLFAGGVAEAMPATADSSNVHVYDTGDGLWGFTLIPRLSTAN